MAEGLTPFFDGLASDPTLKARHHTVGAITLIPLLLNLLVAGQINVFRQWRPFTHPHVHLLRLAVAGQRLQPVDVVAIHDPWLWVEMRRDSRGNGGLGSGDSPSGVWITLSAIHRSSAVKVRRVMNSAETCPQRWWAWLG